MNAPLTADQETGAFIAALASVGMMQAHVTVLSLDEGKIDGKQVGGAKVRFIPNMSTDALRVQLPGIIADATARECSVIVSHPLVPGVKLIQCDDVSEEVLQQLRPVSFMQFQTSAGSFQAWVAMSEADAASGDYYRRLRKGVGSDKSASESTRVPGSKCCKAKYGPDYPTIRLLHLSPKRIATVTEIEATGLLAEATPVLPQRVTAPLAPFVPAAQQSSTSSSGQKWPDYSECESYGLARGSREQADIRFAQIAAWRGFDVKAIESEIYRLSPKCRDGEDRPERYAERKAILGVELASKYPDRTTFGQGARAPQNSRFGSVRSDVLPDSVTASHSLAMASSVATVEVAAPPPEIADLGSPPRASSEPRPDGIFATEGAVGSRTLAFVSSPQDARALGALGVPAVSLGSQFPPWLKARTALRRVVIATRPGPDGDFLARRIIAACTLASLAYVPFPEVSDEATLLATFAQFVEQQERPAVEEAPPPLITEDAILAPPGLPDELPLIQTLPDPESLSTGSLKASEAPSDGLLGYVGEILTSGLDGYGCAEYERDLRSGQIALPGIAEPGAGLYDGVAICYDRPTFSQGRCSWPEGLVKADGLDESLYPPCGKRFKGNSQEDLFHKFFIHVAVVHRAIPYGIGGS